MIPQPANVKRNQTALDAPRRAVHRLYNAQEDVRRHLVHPFDRTREQAEVALTEKTDASIEAALAAPALLKYLDDLAGKLLTEATTADARVREGEDPALVLSEFSAVIGSLAHAVGD